MKRQWSLLIKKRIQILSNLDFQKLGVIFKIEIQEDEAFQIWISEEINQEHEALAK